MTKSTLGDLQDDLDSHDFHDTMEYVAALTDSALIEGLLNNFDNI